MRVSLNLTFAIFVAVTIYLHTEFSRMVPAANGDEIPHLVQVGYYCNGSFNMWHSKITTLPGLYIFSVGILKPVEWIFNLENTCSIVNLRLLSLVSAFGIFYVLNAIISIRFPDVGKEQRIWATINLILFPNLFFYYFKFYTEALSTWLLVLMHYYFLTGSVITSAVYGALAVGTRQTNIVWVFWHLALTILPSVKDAWRIIVEELDATGNYKLLKYNSSKFRHLYFKLGNNFMTILRQGGYYIVVIVAFVVFVVVNKGIVVGDRANHHACLNLPQLGYFLLYSGVFLMPIIITKTKETCSVVYGRYRMLAVILLLVSVVIVHYKTMIHPFLISNSKHYTHYVANSICIWYPSMKYALVPFYIIIGFWIFIEMQTNLSEKVLFGLCVALIVVPQLLLEFRYFMPPYLFLRLQINAFKRRQLAGELILYVVVNYVTIYKYLYDSWETPLGPKRMMW